MKIEDRWEEFIISIGVRKDFLYLDRNGILDRTLQKRLGETLKNTPRKLDPS